MKETAYLLQAALVGAWWVGLATSRPFFDAFQFDGIPSIAFWAFFAPDVFLIAALSLVRAYRKLIQLEFVILGAFGYATLYCLNAMLLTRSGVFPAGVMLLGLAYNVFVCFSNSMFRNASSNFSQNLTKTVVQIICIWIVALVVVPYVILEAFDKLCLTSWGVSFYFGATTFSLFSCLGLASAYIMVRDGAGTPLPLDQTNKLVTTGPYNYVRNPMAVAGIGQGLSIALVFHSIPIFTYAILGAIVWHFVVRPIEERQMEARFGQKYKEYRRHVSCWVPRIRRRAK